MGLQQIGATLRVLRPFAYGLLLAAGTACSVLPRTNPEPTPTPGPPVAAFHINGRAMLRHEQRLDHFRFDWNHTGDRDELLITSPFGQGLAQVLRSAEGTSVRWPDGRAEYAANLPALAQQLFGQPIPLDQLPEWLRGARAQTSGHIDGWQITVDSTYQIAATSPEDSTHILPRSLSIRRNDTLLRLIVDVEASP